MGLTGLCMMVGVHNIIMDREMVVTRQVIGPYCILPGIYESVQIKTSYVTFEFPMFLPSFDMDILI
jgi:hypothetical protein